MKKTLILLSTISAILMTGCGQTAIYVKKQDGTYRSIELDPAKKEAFKKEFKRVALLTKTDPNYNKLNLKEEDRKWFRSLTHMYWNGTYSKQKFISEGLKKYPGHEYELNFIATNLRKER